MIDPFGYSKYLLVIAHPDDEVNCAVLLHRLLGAGKQVRVVLLTNGDAGANPEGRIEEMFASAERIGLRREDLLPLGIAEKALLANAPSAFAKTLELTDSFRPECVLSLDYEGGHEGHDLASYIASRVAQKHNVVHLVFPDYHFRDMKRWGLEFAPGREPDYTLALNDDEKDLKISLIEAHRGQVGFYLRLQKNQDNYFALLFAREVYRLLPSDYDFLRRPDYQVGYEHHRNGFKFDDVARAIKSIG